MKKEIFLTLVILAVIVGLSSCGANRAQSRQEVTGDIAIAAEPCEEYAMKEPARRASGTGMHFQETTARNLAELNARAQLARNLQTCIESATSSYSGGTTLFSADSLAGVPRTDQTASIDDKESGIAKELVKGATVVKQSKYMTKNNQYRIYVCVEYNEDVPQVAAKVAKAMSELLTPEQKTKVKFDEEMFRQKMEATFKDYSGASMQ